MRLPFVSNPITGVPRTDEVPFRHHTVSERPAAHPAPLVAPTTNPPHIVSPWCIEPEPPRLLEGQSRCPFLSGLPHPD
jgi:hypothetical protein